MKIRDVITAVSTTFSLSEMASRQGSVIDRMEGFAFQISVHITKILNSPSLSDELKSKWVQDITKQCNLLHNEHQNNGRHPIRFEKTGTSRRLTDHSLAKIRSELRNYDYSDQDRESEYTRFLLGALQYSQNHYNDLSPFTTDWVSDNLTGK